MTAAVGTNRASGDRNVMQQRDRGEHHDKRVSAGQAWQKLDLFPTPPWGTRALYEIVFPMLDHPPGIYSRVMDPCAGLGHMSDVLAEYAETVIARDIYTYDMVGPPPVVPIGFGDFLDPRRLPRGACDWLIFNPPFNALDQFLPHALHVAAEGVAMLARLSALPGVRRYEAVYARNPPDLMAVFSNRLSICEGGIDLRLRAATDYAWFIWLTGVRGRNNGWIRTELIRPDAQLILTREYDLMLAQRHVPGFVPPSLKRRDAAQGDLLSDEILSGA